MTSRNLNVSIHESAVVDEPRSIGAGTKIWHFCHIMPGVEIGENCVLGQNVFLASGVKIGSNVKVQNNVSIYAGVTCEDDVFIGPSVVFTNIKTPRSKVDRKRFFDSTLIREGATIGANSTILCGITIGRYGFIGAGAVVTHSVPDFALLIGAPAHQVGWSCICGVRLLVSSAKLIECKACGQEYTLDANSIAPL